MPTSAVGTHVLFGHNPLDFYSKSAFSVSSAFKKRNKDIRAVRYRVAGGGQIIAACEINESEQFCTLFHYVFVKP